MNIKKCGTCKKIKPINEYTFHPKGKFNTYSKCRTCVTMDYNKCSEEEAIERLNKVDERKMLSTQGKQKCSVCKEIKNKDDENYFHCKDKHGKDRLRSFCKLCDHKIRKNSRIKLRIANRFNDLIAKLKTKCKRKNIKFNLTVEYLNDLYSLQEGKCVLTGLSFQSPEITKLSPYTLSIDRIVPIDGYVVGNVRLTLYAINCALNEWGENIFHELCKSYLNFKGKNYEQL